MRIFTPFDTALEQEIVSVAKFVNSVCNPVVFNKIFCPRKNFLSSISAQPTVSPHEHVVVVRTWFPSRAPSSTVVVPDHDDFMRLLRCPDVISDATRHP